MCNNICHWLHYEVWGECGFGEAATRPPPAVVGCPGPPLPSARLAHPWSARCRLRLLPSEPFILFCSVAAYLSCGCDDLTCSSSGPPPLSPAANDSAAGIGDHEDEVSACLHTRAPTELNRHRQPLLHRHRTKHQQNQNHASHVTWSTDCIRSLDYASQQ